MDEAKKREGFRLAKSAALASFRRIAAELDDARFLRMHLEREPLQSFTKLRKKRCGITLVLEPDDTVVGITNDHDVSLSVAPSPLIGPEIEDIMEVDVREQLVDAVIACEAFFTLGKSGYRQELGFRAAMAAAFSGAADVGLTRKAVFHLVNRAYDVRSRIVHGSEINARDLALEAAPDNYPTTTDDRLNILVWYVAELVRASLFRELISAAAGSKIVIDWDSKFFAN